MLRSSQAVKKALQRNQITGEKPVKAAQGPDPYDAQCPTRMVLDRIGDKWSVLVLGLLCDRSLRFNELRRGIDGLTQKMLSQTLKALERDGLVARSVTLTSPVSVAYAMTPLGKTLSATLEDLIRWAQTHIDDVIRSQRRYDAAVRSSTAAKPVFGRLGHGRSAGLRS